MNIAKSQAIELLVSCVAIALGFMIVEILNKYLSMLWGKIRGKKATI